MEGRNRDRIEVKAKRFVISRTYANRTLVRHAIEVFRSGLQDNVGLGSEGNSFGRLDERIVSEPIDNF
jgi:hypothetical protein